MRVSWYGALSDIFWLQMESTGWVLSPILFCVYTDNVWHALSASGIGCCIENVFVGALVYAEDIIVIAPSACAMQKLFRIMRQLLRETIRHKIWCPKVQIYIVFLAKNMYYLRIY